MSGATDRQPSWKPPVPGGNDANTKLLLHFDGANGGTVFTDSSASPYTISGGGRSTSTAQSKFGGSSGLMVMGQWISFTDTGKLDFGTGNFTIDWWMRPTSYPSGLTTSIAGANNGDWQIAFDTSGKVALYQRGTSIVLQEPNTYPLNAWTHYAFMRRSGLVSTFINGITSASITDTRALNISGSFGIGDMIGYMDELRVSNIARYENAKSFIPRSAPYN